VERLDDGHWGGGEKYRSAGKLSYVGQKKPKTGGENSNSGSFLKKNLFIYFSKQIWSFPRVSITDGVKLKPSLHLYIKY